MSLQFPLNRYGITLFLILSISMSGLMPRPTLAQNDGRKPVVISFGQPNIWSLEQAHYLLARMHMANLDLQAKTLTDEELDPNLSHGSRIQILKQLLEISGEFDQGIGFQNERAVESARFNDTRRRNLITNRDRLRADSLQLSLDVNQLRRERQTITDPTSDRAKELDAEIKQKEDNKTAIDSAVGFHDSEITKLGAEPQVTPSSPTPSASPINSRLPASLIDTLKQEQLNKLLDDSRDPKLNATTKLDNTVQLQYEIIAKQLTLLRDEVGPGERLVFLELPQSLYTTPGSGDEKMAQTWWHVNGYTRTDPLVRLLLELYEVEWKWKRIQAIRAFQGLEAKLRDVKCAAGYKDVIRAKYIGDDRLNADVKFAEMYHEFRCERESARERVLRNIFREASSDFDRVEQGGARDTSKILEAIQKIIGTEAILKRRKMGTFAPSGIERKFGANSREEILKLRDELLNLLSDSEPMIDGSIPPTYTFDQGIEYVSLDKISDRFRKAEASPSPNPASSPIYSPTPDTVADIEGRMVRTVDIIPRQSSLNVNDIQATVKATGILAAFKFLFGFAGQVNFQRQREQFEQFVHQELFASGFGKGSRDFGWTFGALPGTNRVAPGVRTTYAALIVPDDADSIVLSARGCYFPRKSYQPLDFVDTAHSDWSRDNRFGRYNCGDQQTYVLTVPGGGNTSNFWVTSVNYEPVKKGEFVTVSVRGNNFSAQMGVLVNGVPLHTTVGLAQPHLLPKRAAAKGASPLPHPSECSDNAGSQNTMVCGRYERVDTGQIIFSFRLPAESNIGIPTITLVAPGKSVDLNSLINLTVNGTQLGKDAADNYELLVERNERVPLMFGIRPSLSDVQLVSGVSSDRHVDAVLIGSGFENAKDTVYVNGVKIDTANRTFKSANLYELKMPVTLEPTLKFTVVQDKAVVTKSIPNPLPLKISNITNLGYDPPTNNRQGVLRVRIDGQGFSPRVTARVISGAQQAIVEFVSASQINVTLIGPGVTIDLELEDALIGSRVSRVIRR